MTLLHRWRFHPAFPCPPCIPESRCWPDRPQAWQRLARRRLVFRCLVAMDGLVSPLLSFRDKQGPVFGLALGVGLVLNIVRFFDEVSALWKANEGLVPRLVLCGSGSGWCAG